MKRGKKILAFLLIITMLLPFVMNIPAEAAEKSKQLDVLFTHDTHSHLNSFSTIVDGEQKEVGGFAKLKTLIDEKKKENPDTLILDGGDFSMGTLIWLWSTETFSFSSDSRALAAASFFLASLSSVLCCLMDAEILSSLFCSELMLVAALAG